MMNKLIILGLLLANPVFAATDYYIDWTNGNDTYAGTKLAPWKHAPGMRGCSDNCAAYQTAHSDAGSSSGAGNRFILKGGVTWPAATLSWDWIYGIGTTANPIYFGVDQTWYAGESWTRPVLDAENGVPTYSGYTYDMARFYGDGFVVDNLEFKRLAQMNNSTPAYPTMLNVGTSSNISTQGIEVKNNYFHGWTHGGTATQDNMMIFQSVLWTEGPDLKLKVHDNVWDGSDTAKDMACAIKGSVGHIYNNYFKNLQNGIIASNIRYVWGNTFEEIGTTTDFDATQHHQSIEQNMGESIIYNNYIKNSSGGGTILTYAADGLKDYIFNNVIIGDVNQSMQLGTKNGSTVTLITGVGYELYVFNNTIQTLDGASSHPISGPGSSDAALIPLMVSRNNHLMGPLATVVAGSGVNVFTESNETSMTNAQAASANYVSSGTYPYSPPAGGATVDAGYSMASVCAGVTDSAPSTPTTACTYDTTLGVSYDATTHTVTHPARTAVARGATWDIGAYEYNGESFPVDGVCGSAAGVAFSSVPTDNLCSAGTPTAVTGTGPWIWSCLGINGGADAQCGANLASFTLTINKTGSGNGSVTPNSGVLSWIGLTGKGTWLCDTQVVLTGTPDNLSVFGGWSGGCVPSGSDCTATMTTDRTVTATFTAAPRAKIGANGYATLNEAYAAASPTGAVTILTLDTDLFENLDMDQGKDITITGGYNASYSARTGNPTSLAGVLAILSGNLTVDGLAIK